MPDKAKLVMLDGALRFARRCHAPRLRTMREFAEADFVIPDGPYEGLKFKAHRQPYAGLFLDAVDSEQWTEFAALGPTQSGKTMTCFVLPVLYHLFEIGETMILGIPTGDMAIDKWREDLEPAIRASRFADLIPTKGAGSRGGSVRESVKFRNGATLKFMTGGGGDEKRSSYTARVAAVTEVDKMDEAGEMSREADPVTQIKARSDAYGENARFYEECTVSIAEGRIWQDYHKGTQSRIVCPCPLCGEYVTLEREHLRGWQDATSDEEAAELAHFVCPACEKLLTAEQRREMNRAAKLVHRGQEIDKNGTITGDSPRTNILGFRWNGFNNLFQTPGDIGRREWRAKHALDAENAEKELRQFVWALPYIPDIEDITPLTLSGILKRRASDARGICPEGTTHTTIGIDIGKRVGHWSLLAFSGTTSQVQVVNYGVIEFNSDELGAERGVLAGLRDFRDNVLAAGFAHSDGVARPPGAVWIDSGYLSDTIYMFCRESGPTFLPTKGHGASQDMGQSRRYNQPKSTGAIIRKIGDGYHVCRLRKQQTRLVELDVDAWKAWVHERLATVRNEPGAMVLFAGTKYDHTAFIKHLIAEKRVQEFDKIHGLVYKWLRLHANNHWLDATTLAAAAGHHVGWRLVESGAALSGGVISLADWMKGKA